MNEDSKQIRILAVDDHPILRQGIAGLIADESDMTLVAEAANGREAIQQFRTHRPDVTLMDLQMPEMNGLDAMIAIRGEFPDARIIVLTTYTGDVQAMRALQAGARAYLLKNSLHKELLDTIRAVHAGRKTLSPEVSFELAEHAAEDALSPAGSARPEPDRRGQYQSKRLRRRSRSPKMPSRDKSETSLPSWALMIARRRLRLLSNAE